MKGFVIGLFVGLGLAGGAVFADEGLPPYMPWMLIGTGQAKNFYAQVLHGAEDTYIFMPTKDALYVGIEGRYTSIQWKDLEMFAYQIKRSTTK